MPRLAIRFIPVLGLLTLPLPRRLYRCFETQLYVLTDNNGVQDKSQIPLGSDDASKDKSVSLTV